MCSHLLWEIENICDDVVILSSGQVIVSGSVRDVMGRNQRSGIRLTVAASAAEEAERLLKGIPDVTRVAPVTGLAGCLRMDLATTGAEDNHINNRVLDVLIRARIPIVSLANEGSRLEEVFLQLTDKGIK